QYGVQTDTNGLYYMRARYYNTDIRRFINQDILTGSIENSQSLNRYCYVQGNPIRYTDPFGLCPQNNGSFSSIGHTVLDVIGFIPGVRDVVDVINAGWYLLEGNEEMAALSAMSALPLIGSVVGSGIRLGFKASKFFNKAAKTAKYIEKISEVVSYTGSFTVSAVNLKHDVTNAIKEYKATGSISAESVFSILADGLGVGLSGKGLVSSGKSLRKMLQSDFTGVGKNTSLKEKLSKNKFGLGNQAGGNGNRLSYDLQYFASKGVGNPLLKGEGDVGTYKELIDAGRRGDNLTPHHMPSAEYMKNNGISRNNGISMNMEQPAIGGRHRLTDTYGRNMTDAEKANYYSLSPRDALAHDLWNAREIYIQQGKYTHEIREGLLDVIKRNKSDHPNLFNK
ncbi:RHS repeat-associated core domain-containing protein, partial [Anaerosacchariphilus polymeriproducens]